MSFASDTKKELCGVVPRRCCRKAECYGLLLFGRSFSEHSVCLITENRTLARRTAQLAAEVTGAIVDTASPAVRRSGSRRAYTVYAAGENQAPLVVNTFGHTGREISLRINLANLENDCCPGAFLRGAFLACGTVADPQREYHLEFVVPYMNLARDLAKILSDLPGLELQPGLTNRKGSFVVYVKGGDAVTDLLALIGAGKAAMELMQVRMLKEVRNNVNRKTNFETANLDKTASASAEQRIAIERIAGNMGLSALPQELRELAELRYRNPEMSLRELGQNLSPPLSRSGVHHRLQRIVQIANKKKN